MNARTTHTIFNVAVASLIILSIIFAILATGSQHTSNQQLQQSLDNSETEQRLQGVVNAMNSSPGGVGKDVLFLRSLSSVQSLAQSSSSANVTAATADITAFAAKNEIYEQLYVFVDGACTLAVGRQDVASCQSQSPAILDALQHANQLPPDGIYVLPMTMEPPSSTRDGSLILMYASGSSSPGKGVGVVAAVDTKYFLEEVRRLNRPDEQVLLLDDKGHYLVHSSDVTKENKKDHTFLADYPSIPANTLRQGSNMLEIDSQSFTLQRVYPTGGGFSLNTSAKDGANNDYYWTLVSIAPAQTRHSWWQSNMYLVSILGIVGLQLVIVALLLMRNRTYRTKIEQEDRTHAPQK